MSEHFWGFAYWHVAGVFLAGGVAGPLFAWRSLDFGGAETMINFQIAGYALASARLLYKTDRALDPTDGRRAFKRMGRVLLIGAAALSVRFTPLWDLMIEHTPRLFFGVSAIIGLVAVVAVGAAGLMLPKTDED